VWWYRPVIVELGRLRQEDLEFNISLVCIVRSCLRKERKGRKEGGKKGRKEEKEKAGVVAEVVRVPA
jgi:hypothetical protein